MITSMTPTDGVWDNKVVREEYKIWPSGRGGGDLHVKGAGKLVGNFELNPYRRRI